MPNSTLTKVTTHDFTLSYTLSRAEGASKDEVSLPLRMYELLEGLLQVKPELKEIESIWDVLAANLPVKNAYDSVDIAYLVGWIRGMLSVINIVGVDAGEVQVCHSSNCMEAEISLKITITHR